MHPHPSFSTPIYLISGRSRFTNDATPQMSPPPPTGNKNRMDRASDAEEISMPIVPCRRLPADHHKAARRQAFARDQFLRVTVGLLIGLAMQHHMPTALFNRIDLDWGVVTGMTIVRLATQFFRARRLPAHDFRRCK